MTLGVGLESDEFGGEYSMTGEELDDRRRARMLDESLEILAAAWSGEPVHHRGEHYTVDGMQFLPRPVQRPGVQSWSRASTGSPSRRHQGFFPVDLEHPDQLAKIVADLAPLRNEAGTDPTEPCDVVAALPPGSDPTPYAAAGATWWLVHFPADAVSVDEVQGVIRDGPAAPGVTSAERSFHWTPDHDPAVGQMRALPTSRETLATVVQQRLSRRRRDCCPRRRSLVRTVGSGRSLRHGAAGAPGRSR